MTDPRPPAEPRLRPEQWARVEAIFHMALERPAEERRGYVEGACDDPGLRAEVMSLLEEASSGDGWIDELLDRASALADTFDTGAEPSSLAGRCLGAYRLEREIGRGGTSLVYLARRSDGAFDRSVAVKVLTGHANDPLLVRRFRREQQVLSDLVHPNIAALYDGGVTDEGLPYFVMEHVEGLPIDRYCQDGGLGVEDRIRLFLEVVAAVEYAHRNLVIHRDLKPSNILVTAEGHVKLLDFGLAQIVAGEGGGPEAGLTRRVDRWMTPEYAAPEQVRGERTTTATDVYQLGVVLYELLVGRRPYPDSGGSAFLLEKAVCETEPARPSAAAPRADSGRLRRALAGDLDAIILMALRKEVPLRYPSAGALGLDLRRYLEGRPVEARQGDRRYHALKFLRRHARGVTAAALALIAFLVVTALYTAGVARERDRARLESAKATEVTEFMLELFEAGHPEEDRGRLLTAPDLLERGIARAEALETQPALQAQVLATVGRAYHAMGDFERSDTLFERSLRLRRNHLAPRHADVGTSLGLLGWSRLVQGDYASAEIRFDEALTIHRAALGPGHPEVANALHGLALAINGRGRTVDAIRMLRSANEIRRARLGPHPELANGLHDMALLLIYAGDGAGARQLAEESLAMRRRLLDPDHPAIGRSADLLAGLLQEAGEITAAEELYREALRILRQALGDDHASTLAVARRLAGLRTE